MENTPLKKGSEQKEKETRIVFPLFLFILLDTMMYKLLLESSGKRDQRTIVDIIFEMLRDAEIFSETDTKPMENLIVVQRLLAVMIQAVEEKPGAVKRPSNGLKKKSSSSGRRTIKREKSKEREQVFVDPEMDLGGMPETHITHSIGKL